MQEYFRVSPPSVHQMVLTLERADELEYAQLVKDNVSVAPIYSGLDGGMNQVFHARFPGKIVPLAIVLPPGSGTRLPQLPAVPWADNDGSLANKLFGASFGSKSARQTQVASTVSTAQASPRIKGIAGRRRARHLPHKMTPPHPRLPLG